MRITRLLKDDLDEFWPDVEYLISSALRYADRKYSSQDILLDLTKGDKQLWVVYTKTDIVGCVVTEILLYPQEKRLGIFIAAGRDFESWVHLRVDIYAWAKRYGCKTCEFYGRKGWERKLPSFKLIHICMTEDIK